MNKLKNTIKKIRLFWSEEESDNIYVSQNEHAQFNVMLGKLLIGTLKLNNEQWQFSYSQQFKEQTEIQPLSNFLDKDKTYNSTELWPFFATRIPSKAQRQRGNSEETNIVELLRTFGRRTIANPYELCPA